MGGEMESREQVEGRSDDWSIARHGWYTAQPRMLRGHWNKNLWVNVDESGNEGHLSFHRRFERDLMGLSAASPLFH